MRYVYLIIFFVVVLSVSILGFRGSLSTRSPLEVFPDMDHQAKYKPQAESKFFADGRADRPRAAGTVAYGRTVDAPDAHFLKADTVLFEGKDSKGAWVAGYPSAVTIDPSKLLERGQDRYTIYCAPCHGAVGDGNGITKQYGMGATPTYHDERLRTVANGELFNVITHGKGNMLSYADKLSAEDRWAVIAYVRALQRAAHATAADVPPGHKSELGIK
ncbi:c-type cytochrome [Rariglobus hedericola]|uniref:Cytochrome c n=1 Tax=Rariglobus hedericola TaxID=2597822 RepID=A0A556QEQ3_9BACT|nr:cytochrome c [Rariglobus hedericola]TSJ75129.1 cytochrome c [Rariglobus hedericola]